MKSVLEYIGKIDEGNFSEGGLRIGLRNLGEIADDINEHLIKSKNGEIHVSYLVSDVDLSKDEFLENRLLTLFGASEVWSRDVYGTEWTGYMWTEQEFKVGEHDLLKELSLQDGKYCYLKIYNAIEKRNIAIDDVLK